MNPPDCLEPVLLNDPKDRHVLPTALRASHTKPWALCQSDSASLIAFIGLVLAAHLDTVEQSQLILSGHRGRGRKKSMSP